MRTFGVEEELLIVDAESYEPLPRGSLVVAGQAKTTPDGHKLTTEFKQEQVEVNSPPQYTLAGQLEAIRTGRALAHDAAAYEAHRQALFHTGVPLDAGMLYFDARASDHQPTLEVRVADVCLNAEHAAVIAALARALVETAVRHQDQPPREVPVTVLRAWTWQASRYGVEAELIDPHTGTLAPAQDVVAQFLHEVQPVLTEYHELQTVEAVVADMLHNGTGAQLQRRAYAHRRDFQDVMREAIEVTHDHRNPQRISHGIGVE